MSNLINFEIEYRKANFVNMLDKKNAHFLEKYHEACDAIQLLWKEKTGEKHMGELGSQPTNAELFETEDEFKSFYQEVLVTLGITETSGIDLTFKAQPKQSTIQHSIGVALFERDYADLYKNMNPTKEQL